MADPMPLRRGPKQASEGPMPGPLVSAPPATLQRTVRLRSRHQMACHVMSLPLPGRLGAFPAETRRLPRRIGDGSHLLALYPKLQLDRWECAGQSAIHGSGEDVSDPARLLTQHMGIDPEG